MHMKADASPVTAADLAVQAFVSIALKGELIAEESTVPHVLTSTVLSLVRAGVRNHARTRGRRIAAPAPRCADDLNALLNTNRCAAHRDTGAHWVLDPIDGTKGFLRERENAQFAVALAKVDASSGEPIVGLVALPRYAFTQKKTKTKTKTTMMMSSETMRGILVCAERGYGAWWTPLTSFDDAPGAIVWRRAHVDDARFMSEASVIISDHEDWNELPLAQHYDGGEPRAVRHLCCGSIAKYIAVALGHASVFVQHPRDMTADSDDVQLRKTWDHAAAWPILLEAGGYLSDLDGPIRTLGTGEDFAPAGNCIIASSTSSIDESVRAALQRAFRQ